jgi:hypothetical protein
MMPERVGFDALRLLNGAMVPAAGAIPANETSLTETGETGLIYHGFR